MDSVAGGTNKVIKTETNSWTLGEKEAFSFQAALRSGWMRNRNGL